MGKKIYQNLMKTLQKKYDENSNIGYFFEVDIGYPEKLFNLHNDLPFLPERKNVNKVEKLICSIEDKVKYVIHIKVLKQALNHGLVLRKVHRVIQFNQEDWLKPYIDMNTKLRKEAKNNFEKDSFKISLFSEPNYHTKKRFSENLLAKEKKKTKVKLNKPVYLGMSILDISKTLMYKF